MSAQKTLGFTLIELMIVVAVVAILAAIAYPSYQNQVRKTRMGQAQADMLELAQFMERCFVANNTYAGCLLPFNASPRTGAPFYAIGFVGLPNRQGFVLRATPQPTGGRPVPPGPGPRQPGCKWAALVAAGLIVDIIG